MGCVGIQYKIQIHTGRSFLSLEAEHAPKNFQFQRAVCFFCPSTMARRFAFLLGIHLNWLYRHQVAAQ